MTTTVGHRRGKAAALAATLVAGLVVAAPGHAAEPRYDPRAATTTAECATASATRTTLRLDNRRSNRPVTFRVATFRASGTRVARVRVQARDVVSQNHRVRTGQRLRIAVRARGARILNEGVRPRRCNTLLFGDSLTWNGRPYLEALRPTWTIDTQRGRHVRYLVPLLREYLDTHRVPDRLVIALGTMEEGASKELYLEAIAMLPEDVHVGMVTPYRDAAVFGVPRSELMGQIAQWMGEIASERPHTCVIPWRARVLREPSLLIDGVHGTEEGKRVWANLVARHTHRCP